MRPNQIKYRFHDHKREGSRSSHRRRRTKKKKNTNKIGTARKERNKDTVEHNKERRIDTNTSGDNEYLFCGEDQSQ